MLPHDLTREWLVLPSPGSGDLRLLGQHGVTCEAIHRAGGLAIARINTGGRIWMPEPTGTPAFTLPAWDGPAPSIYCGVSRKFSNRRMTGAMIAPIGRSPNQCVAMIGQTAGSKSTGPSWPN